MPALSLLALLPPALALPVLLSVPPQGTPWKPAKLACGADLLDGRVVAVSVFEKSQGATDLNGDGHTSDLVLHAIDAGTHAVRNLGIAMLAGGSPPILQVGADAVATRSLEALRGAVDQTGDGDAADALLYVHALP